MVAFLAQASWRVVKATNRLGFISRFQRSSQPGPDWPAMTSFAPNKRQNTEMIRACQPPFNEKITSGRKRLMVGSDFIVQMATFILTGSRKKRRDKENSFD